MTFVYEYMIFMIGKMSGRGCLVGRFGACFDTCFSGHFFNSRSLVYRAGGGG